METKADDTNGRDPSKDDIALKILKERCCMLQLRINALERENAKLSARAGDPGSIERDAGEDLHATVSRLTAEKSQLARHVFAVADENRRMWSLLSPKSAQIEDKRAPYVVPPLARSQTFTQPRKSSRSTEPTDAGDDLQTSLEDISLKLINGFLLEKSELVHQYEQMVQMQMEPEGGETAAATSSLTDPGGIDSLAEVRKQAAKINEAKRAAVQQQLHLKRLLNMLSSKKFEKEECPKCAAAPKNSPRASARDSDDTSTARSHSDPKTPTEVLPDKPPPHQSTNLNHNDRLELLDRPDRDAEPYWHSPAILTKEGIVQRKNVPRAKTCPMCGKIFQHLSFDEFELHVETHFIGDDDVDSINDNFEVIANSIGNNFN